MPPCSTASLPAKEETITNPTAHGVHSAKVLTTQGFIISSHLVGLVEKYFVVMARCRKRGSRVGHS